MQKYTIVVDSTSVILPISVYDSSSTTGEKLGGLVFNTAGLVAYYNKTGSAGSATAITLATATKGTYTSGGFVAIDGTNMLGDYELHLPDVVLSSGVGTLMIQLRGAANMSPVNISIDLISGSVDVGSWSGTPVTTSATTNKPEMDLFSVSDDSSSADAMALQWNGTGILGDTYPSTQSQVNSIGAASGGAVNIAATIDNRTNPIKGLSIVGTPTGVVADTESNNGIYVDVLHADNNIEYVLGYFSGVTLQAISAFFAGYLLGSNDKVEIRVYDFPSSAWPVNPDFIVDGQPNAGNINQPISLLSKHTGTVGEDLGWTYINFRCTAQTSPRLFIDQFIISSVNTTVSRGFLDNAVWIDTVNGVAGTGQGVGFASSPSDNITDAKTIADANNLNKLRVQSGSNLGVMPFGLDGYEVVNMGTGALVNLGGQSMSSTLFNRMRIQGDDDGSNAQRTFYDNCRFDGNTLGDFFSTDCSFGGDVVFAQASNTYTVDIPRPVSATPPTFDFALLTSIDLICTRVSTDIYIKRLAATSTAQIHGDGGNITLDANCTGGVLTVYGNFTLTDNSGGSVTVVDGGKVSALQINSQCASAITSASLATAGALATAQAGIDTVITAVGTTLPGLLREQGIAKNEVFSNFEFLMVLSSDDKSPAPGLTVTGQRSVDGGSFIAVSGTITEVSNGLYKFDGLAADTNGDVITWRFSSATANDRWVTFKTVQ